MQHLIQLAHSLADQAGKIARDYFRKPLDLKLKTGRYLVTEADQAIEQYLRDTILTHYPDHGILGEEYGTTGEASEYLWVIDPIDGTTAFAAGKPTFTTLIALIKNDKPLFGLIDQPILKERWMGIRHQKTQMNTQFCQPSRINLLAEARLNCTTPDMFQDLRSQKIFSALKKTVMSISYGGDAYAYGLLAMGYIDVILEADLKFYDVATLIPVIEGAGGIVTDWQGHPLTQTFDGTCLAAANVDLHRQALEVICDVTRQ